MAGRRDKSEGEGGQPPGDRGDQAPSGRAPGAVRSAWKAFGICVVIVSAFFVAVAAYELVTGQSESEPSTLVGLVVFFLGTAIGGVMLARANSAPPGPRAPAGRRLSEEQEREQGILDLARQEHGRVTVEEVASHCDLSLEEAKAALDRLAAHAVAELRVTDGGVLVYLFPGFLSDEEKRKAGQF
jgi:hypothetical protein